jgi:FkbM family methyltransferase
MLDVGAHHGGSLAPFARDGWTVHAFEPDATNRAALLASFGHMPNVTVVPKGVSDQPGVLPLFTSAESSGISSFAAFTAGHVASGDVETVTLRDYLSDTGTRTVDFLKIDVEGFERHVLRGYDWSVRPGLILLEFEDSKTVPLGYTWKELADELVDRGYEVLVSEWFPLQRYGEGHKWRRFATYPTELSDPAAWGNLLAAPTLDGIARASTRARRRAQLRQRIERLVGRR